MNRGAQDMERPSRQNYSQSIGAPAPMDAKVQQLLDLLQDKPLSRTELQEALGVKRGVLLKRYLHPAMSRGLVVATEKGSSPNQRYKLAVAPEDMLNASAGQALSTPPIPTSEIGGTGLQPPSAGFFGGREQLAIAPARERDFNLVRFVRFDAGERAVIQYWRIERYLRSMLASNDWKKLGVITGGSEELLCGCRNFLIDPMLWGPCGGVALLNLEYDSKAKRYDRNICGETTLLNYLANKLGANADICSETERAEMQSLAGIISEKEVLLMNYYTQTFEVSRSLAKPYHGEKQAMQPVAVAPYVINSLPAPKIVFHGKGRAVHHALIRTGTAFGTMLLPVAYYSSALNPALFCMMPEMPDSPVLYNSDAIAAYPGAEIVLSDEIGVPLFNVSNSTRIFSTWYGGLEVIEHLDFDLLRGHRILWFCFDDGAATDPAEKFKKALRVADVFQKHGIGIRVLLFDTVIWRYNEAGMETGDHDNVRELSTKELALEASKFGIGDHKSEDDRAMTMDELINTPEREFVLYPVLKDGFYCLIYGGSGVAKTWFALHVAIAISQGATPFAKWEFRGKPMNVLYVAGEMDVGVYGERIEKLLAGQKTNQRFRLVRKDLDLTTEEDQTKIGGIIRDNSSRMLVFDNLSTLATNGHTEGQFQKILKFFKQLQRQGIIVLLVHHENREGGFKGSGKIELVADQSLHLFATGRGDKIELLVQAEKIRMTARSEQNSFRTEFDLQNPVAVWPMYPLNEEERRRLNEDDPLDEVGQNVGKKRNNQQRAWTYLDDDERAAAIIDDMLTGCLDDVIAANLAIPPRAVVEFKNQYGITEDELKKHLPDAKKTAARNCGKTTPEVLAPELWKLMKDDAASL